MSSVHFLPARRRLLSRLAAWSLALLTLFCALYPFYLQHLAQLTRAETARIAAQPGPPGLPLPARLDAIALLADFAALADSEMQGRRAGQPGMVKARTYLQQRFAAIGLEPAGRDGYLQTYQATPGRFDDKAVTGVNLIGRIAGTDPTLKPIVLTAHYDHLGEHQGRIYHGADDNASGVAAMLALAQYLKSQPLRHPVLVIALDHEEQGMQGAAALFDSGLLQASELALNLNMDMLSRDTEQQLFAVGTSEQPLLKSLLQQLQLQSFVALKLGHDQGRWQAGYTQDWRTASDHRLFRQHGVPYLYFGVPDHADYHQPTDTFDRADLPFYQAVCETILSGLLLLDAELP